VLDAGNIELYLRDIELRERLVHVGMADSVDG
jgi:hypothetical protein